MKFKVLILTVLFAINLAACKKDSKSAGLSIEGTWYITDYKVSTVKNGVEEVLSNTNTENYFGIDYYFTFDGHHSGTQHSADSWASGEFNYTFSNSVLTVKPLFFVSHHDTFTVAKTSDTNMTFTVKTINTDGSYSLEVLTLSKIKPAGF